MSWGLSLLEITGVDSQELIRKAVVLLGLGQSACIHADQVACWRHFDRGHLGVLVSFVDHRRCEESDIVGATGGLT